MTNDQIRLLLETARIVQNQCADSDVRLAPLIKAVEDMILPEEAARIEPPLGGKTGSVLEEWTVIKELQAAITHLAEPADLPNARSAIERAIERIQSIRCDGLATLELL